VDDRILIATKQWTLVQPVVSAFIAAVVRDFSVRDDILQDVAVAVLESYERYDPSRPFQTWALGIARNQIRSYLRRQKKDLLTFDEQVIANLADGFNELAGQQRSLEHLQGCVGKLDPKAIELLELRYSTGLKPAAIAERLHSNANNIAKALQRIRDLLRECIRRQMTAETLR